MFVGVPRSSHTIAVVEGMPPVSSPQLYSGTEAMLVSDPACHTSTPAEGSEMPPVSSPTIDINAGSGVMLTSDPMNNIYTGPGVTPTPGPSTIINTGPGVTSTPVPINNNFVEGSEIPPVSSPALVPYHDPDGHDNHNDIHLGSDTTPVSSSPIHGPSTLEPISPASPSVEAGAVIDCSESSHSPESLCDTGALQLMFPTLPVFHFLENEF